MPEVSDNPTLAEVLKLAIQASLAQVETTLPARITAYDHDKQRASVQPLVQGAFVNDEGERVYVDLPVIPNCPVAFFAAGHASLTSKLEVGDRVTIVFCSRDIGGWLTDDSDRNEPQDPRRHALDDVIVLPGARSFRNPLPDKAVSSSDAVFAADAIQLGSTDATQYIVLAEKLRDWINNQINAVFNAHTHNYTVPAIPAAAGPTLIPNSSMSTVTGPDLQSDKVRSE